MLRSVSQVILLAGVAGAAAAQGPDLSRSTATIDPSAAGSSVFNLPDGTGSPFTAARLCVGLGSSIVVDATITLTLLDAGDDPIFAYPAEDIWLESTLGNLAYDLALGCATIPDASTDIAGVTLWTQPLKAGGWTRDCDAFPATEEVLVMVAGAPVPTPIPLRFNSGDMNGDLTVNLTDISLFSICYIDPMYCYACDFDFDCLRNLTDVSIMASSVGATCP